MITVSVKQLVSAIEEAEAFKLPDMSAGTQYLHESVYKLLSQNMGVKLSEIDFDAFDSEDIGSLCSLYSEVYERNGRLSRGIMYALQEAAPVCKAVGYL